MNKEKEIEIKIPEINLPDKIDPNKTIQTIQTILTITLIITIGIAIHQGYFEKYYVSVSFDKQYVMEAKDLTKPQYEKLIQELKQTQIQNEVKRNAINNISNQKLEEFSNNTKT